MSILSIALQRLSQKLHRMREEDKVHLRIWQKKIAQAIVVDNGYLNSQASFYAPLTHSLVLQKGEGDPTFARATTASFTDWEGVMRYVPAGCARFEGGRMVRNLLTNTGWSGGTSGTLGSGGVAPTGWTALGGTGAITFAASSYGGNSIRFQATAQRPYIQKSVAASANSVYVLSFRVESAATSNLISNLVAIATLPAGATTEYLKNNVVVVGASTNAESGDVIGMRITVSSTSGTPDYRVGLGAAGSPTGDVTISAPQLEDLTGSATQTASEYVSVGVESAPYHGAGVDGVKFFNTDRDGVVIPAATNTGYLAEGARTNLCLQSNAFTTTWADTAGGPTGSATQNAVGITGAPNTAWTLADTDATKYYGKTQSIAVSASTTYTQSLFFAKTTGATTFPYFELGKLVGTLVTCGAIVNTNTGTLAYPVSQPATATITSHNSLFWRVEFSQPTGTTISAVLSIYPAASSTGTTLSAAVTGSCIVEGCQYELGSFASTYIPTTTTAVARNADVLTYPSAGNVDGTKGWCSAGVSTNWNVAPPVNLVAVGFGASIEGIITGGVTGLPTEIRAYDGTNSVNNTSNPTMYLTSRKTAMSWGSGLSISQSGDTPVSGSFDGNIGTTAVGIGCSGAGASQWHGNIRDVRIGQRQLSASEMQAITA